VVLDFPLPEELHAHIGSSAYRQTRLEFLAGFFPKSQGGTRRRALCVLSMKATVLSKAQGSETVTG
jgi:hypothetical protein